jgi:ribonuclease P protein component
MLNKSERLGKTAFTGYFKAGKRFHSEHATLVYAPAPSLHGAVVVSKKVFKRAVDRNTLRRRVYAQLYALKQAQHTGVFIVLLKPSSKTLTKAAVHEHTKELIERTVKQVTAR